MATIIKIVYNVTNPVIKVTYDVTNITIGGAEIAPVYISLDYSSSSAVTVITSVGLTMPTGFSVANSPLTQSGTLAVTYAGGYSLPTTTKQSEWDQSYNDKINSAAVTGTTTKTLTLNQQDGGTVTASWSDIDTGLTSVGLSVPTGLTVTNSPLTTNGTIAVGLASGYSIPTTASQATWDAAYNDKINSAAVTGTTTKTLTLNQQDGGTITASWTDINTDAVTSVFGRTGAVVATGGDYTTSQVTEVTNLYYTEGRVSANTDVAANTAARHNAVTLGTANGLSLSTQALSLGLASGSTTGALSSTDWTTFNNKQVAGNYITALTGEVTASGPGSVAATLLNSAVIGKLLTGLNLAGGGTISSSDSILIAFGKTQNQISALVGGVMYEGVWNASTNSPAIVSSVGSKGDYYVVNVAGSTNIDGITDWKVGDWIIFNGTTWDKVDNTDAVSSVNGFTGAVSLTTANISEVTNLYYTDVRARAAVSLTVSGSSGASTYNNSTGVFNIPTYTLSGLGGVPSTRSITINGTAFDLSADRTYNVGTVTSVAATAGTGITISGSPITTSGTLTITNSAPDQVVSLTGAGTTTISGTYPNFTISSSDSAVGTVTSVGLSSATSGVTIGSTPITTSGTITLAIATATTSQNGLLSSADWTLFNSKQAALSGTGFVKISGTTISYDNTSYLPLTGGTLSSASSAETLRLVNSGTGYGLYNQSDAYFQGDVKFQSVLNTILKVDSSHKLIAAVAGTDYQAPIANPVTGTGTTNYLPKWTSASALGNSALQDDGTTLTYGSGSGLKQIYINAGGYDLVLGASGGGMFGFTSTNASLVFTTTAKPLGIGTGTTQPLVFGTNELEGMRLTSGGNLLVGTTTDSGEKLVVSGSTKVSGKLIVNHSSTDYIAEFINTSSSTPYGVIIKDAASATNNYPLFHIVNNAATVEYFRVNSGTGAATFSSSVTANGLTVAQTGESVITVKDLDGTNTFLNIGHNGGNSYFLSRDESVNGKFSWYGFNGTTLTTPMTITSGGNLLVGTTTDSGYKLDVNGTGSFSGALSGTSATFSGNLNLQAGVTRNINFYDSSNTNINAQIQYDQIASNSGQLLFGTNNAGTFATRLTIANTGAATFSSSVTANQISSIVTSGTARVTIGDGAISGGALLNIAGISGGKTWFISSNYNIGGGLEFIQSTTNGGTTPSSSAAMAITSGGNLLVGTTTDSGYKLDVNGTGRFSYLTTSNTNIFDNTSGRAMDCNSDGVLFTKISGAHNIIFGDGAVRYFSLYTPSGAATMSIRNFSTSTDFLTFIASTGAATFSSSVTATEYNLSALNTAPATSSSTGTIGQIRIDANHIYVCTATNTWKRVAIATF